MKNIYFKCNIKFTNHNKGEINAFKILLAILFSNK